ncbi:MAG TPA: glycosyltransferase family 1 protein [Candidatus Saccharimonadales bacterium]|nr:glycosyltransferase family 1 protein [Candidatus Saccharimonadales bacterium]
MAKIVIDARESGTSTGRYVDNLIKYLHILAPKHSIILLARAERLKFLAELAPRFVVFETPFKEFTFEEQIGLFKQVNTCEADLVHFPMVQQPVFYRGAVVTTMQDLTTLRFKNPTKNPFVFWTKLQVYKWVNKRAARKSVALITPTEFVRQDVAKYTHVSPDKITVTHEAADTIPGPAEPIPDLAGKQFIMYLGRPTPHKNLDRLIRAFELLQRDRPELVLALAGKKDAMYELVEQKARTRNPELNNVYFTGFVSDAQLKWMYKNCRAYCFPSLSEGFGLPGLEAQQHGAPVVCSNATCLPEVYGDSVHYFDPLDIEDMAAKIGEVVDDPILREDLIERGSKNAASYSWRHMAEQTLAVYEAALADQHDRPKSARKK